MPKILYVDDELVNLELFKVNFDKDYTVFTTNNAQEGFNILLNNEEIGVIVTDLKMPGVSGIEFISEIKRKWP
ncbi:MAG: response regulator, partial [Bacteroidales bacterium]|nr:response regulator [Bacteroidales bacterium]